MHLDLICVRYGAAALEAGEAVAAAAGEEAAAAVKAAALLSQRESHERESKGTRGLIALLLQVAIDFPYLSQIHSSGGSDLNRFRLCFRMFFLDVVPSKKHVYKSEIQLAPMQVGQVWVSLYGTTKFPL